MRRIRWQDGETPVEKQLVELCSRTFPEEPWNLFLYSDREIVRTILTRDLARDGSACFGFFNAKGKLIAACWTFPATPHLLKLELKHEQGVEKLPMELASLMYNKKVCYLAGILTDKDHRGNGLGAKLLHTCLEHCQAVGSDIFLLYTYGASAMPRQFMEGNGFTRLDSTIPRREELEFYCVFLKNKGRH